MISIEKDLPQLIVGLDSLDDAANYVHIDDAKDDTNYYCPCCKGIIKPRAYKKHIEYQVQPHFYHESGGCNEETYVHFICKNWLFTKNSKFIVNDVTYTVSSIETEKALHTSFGIYIPDIIVTTTSGKVFYFEIRSTNKKTSLYIPKWDELGNDVVEVDVRYFVNQKYQNEIPTFDLIYSDGECFIKSYTKDEYEDVIASRKREWKRQDKLNYKIQWEKLDWFWTDLQEYYKKNCDIEKVISSFKGLTSKDQSFVCSKLKGDKHKNIKYELENNYTDSKLLEQSRLKHISAVVRKLNTEFDCAGKLHRKNYHLIFDDAYYWRNKSHMEIKNTTTEQDIYDYFHPIMYSYFEKQRLDEEERENKRKEKLEICKSFYPVYEKIAKKYMNIINNCKNKMWNINFSDLRICSYSGERYENVICEFNMKITFGEHDILRNFAGYISLDKEKIEDEHLFENYVKKLILRDMNELYNKGLHGYNHINGCTWGKLDTRIMEVV